MSRIGNRPIVVPPGVKVALGNRTIKVSGPEGELSWAYPGELTVDYDSGQSLIQVRRSQEAPRLRALHGMARALIANMVEGVE